MRSTKNNECPHPTLKRVVIKHFKSIVSCDVALQPLSFLIGLNGSGKSNFVDALRFCRDALRGTLEMPFSERRANLRTLSNYSKEPGFSIHLEVEFGLAQMANYQFTLGQQAPRGFRVSHEECSVGSSPEDGFSVREGYLISSQANSNRQLADDRLHLVQASADPRFRPMYEFLSNLLFYQPEPVEMKVNFDRPGPADLLESDGTNAANILYRIQQESPYANSRVLAYMRRILPGLRDITVEELKGVYKYLQFDQGHDYKLFAESMSDGTLRALAILIALFQRTRRGTDSQNAPPSLVVVEEPETGVHPAALQALLSAFTEVSSAVQVIVTSHSADMLDTYDIPIGSILAFDYDSGSTRIGPIDAASRLSLREKLYSPGELMRMNQISPKSNALSPQVIDQTFEHSL